MYTQINFSEGEKEIMQGSFFYPTEIQDIFKKYNIIDESLKQDLKKLSDFLDDEDTGFLYDFLIGDERLLQLNFDFQCLQYAIDDQIPDFFNNDNCELSDYLFEKPLDKVSFTDEKKILAEVLAYLNNNNLEDYYDEDDDYDYESKEILETILYIREKNIECNSRLDDINEIIGSYNSIVEKIREINDKHRIFTYASYFDTFSEWEQLPHDNR